MPDSWPFRTVRARPLGIAGQGMIARLRTVRANGPVGNEHIRMARIERATVPRIKTELEIAIGEYLGNNDNV